MNEWNPLYTSTVWLVIAALATAGIQGEKWSVRRAAKRAAAGLPLSKSQAVLADGSAGSGIIIGKGEYARELTELDLLLGNRAAKAVRIYLFSAIALMSALAVFVWFSVPLDTTIHFSNNPRKPERMYVIPVLLPAIAFCAMLGGGLRKPDAGHMAPGGRKVVYILCALMVTWCLYLQLFIALECLTAGGALYF